MVERIQEFFREILKKLQKQNLNDPTKNKDSLNEKKEDPTKNLKAPNIKKDIPKEKKDETSGVVLDKNRVEKIQDFY